MSLDDKLSKYFPDYPKGDSVTIHMLLSHTSGITNYTDHDDFWEGPAFVRISQDSLISTFRKKPYDFTPGTNCSYSNSGYILLGRIIEKVSKEDYGSYLQKNIIQPAGMNYTGIDRIDSIMPMRARGYYQSRNGSYYNAGYISFESIWSAGAIISTIDDLHSWTKSLHSNKIISAASVKRMTTQYGVTQDKDRFGYGLIIDSVENHTRIWHDGNVPGYSSYVAYYPYDDLYIIALSNSSSNAAKIGTGLSHLVFGLEIEYPYVHKEITLSEQQLDKFTGKYRATTTFEIIKTNGKLYHKSASGSETELKPESDSRLFYNNYSDRQLQFVFNKNGEIVTVFLLDSGIKKEIGKID